MSEYDLWFEAMADTAMENTPRGYPDAPHIHMPEPFKSMPCGHTWEEQEAAAKRITLEKLPIIDTIGGCPACKLSRYEGALNEKKGIRERIQGLLQKTRLRLAQVRRYPNVSRMFSYYLAKQADARL
jgi:hypothetical protein